MKIKYVAAGFKEDLESLFNLYLTCSSVRFCDFVDCWKKMKFSLIFTCKLNQGEMKDFVEECFRITLKYFKEEREAEKKIAIVYFLYCFYSKQPLDPKIKIRLTLEEFKLFKDLNQLCLNNGHLDTCYMWCKLLSIGAFDFVARERLYGPSYIANTRRMASHETAESSGPSNDKTLLESLSKQVELLQKLDSHYSKMKKKSILYFNNSN